MTWIWLVIIHLIEIVGIGIFFLLRRNFILEKAVVEQQQYIDAISIVINNSQQKLNELDTLGAFKADDEVGTFFRNLEEIQGIINQFNNKR
jgi:hypothetical protein